MRSRSEPAVPKLRFSLLPVVAFEFGAERRHHRLHGARTHDLDFSHVTSPFVGRDRGRAKAVRLGADAFDGRAAAHEFFLEPLEAAIEMIDAVDHGLALGCERGNHQRNGRTKVGRHHRRALEAIDALDRGGLAVELNTRAEPRQLLHMHEAIFEDRLGDVRRPFGARHQRHQLRLQIGRKAREWRGA